MILKKCLHTFLVMCISSNHVCCLITVKSPAHPDQPPTSSPLDRNERRPYCICYYTAWARYRREPANMQPQDVDGNLCTHLIMAFVWITSDGRLALHSEWEDQFVIKGLLSKRKQNPNLKVLVAVGGQHFGSEPFRRVIASNSTRRKFINSTLTFLQKWGLNGLDINWEYPQRTDREKFTYLLKDLRDAFLRASQASNGEKILLTLATPAISDRLGGYDFATARDYVDIVSVMAYDFHGPWENKTGHNAPMYSSDGYNMVDGAKLLVELGVPKQKIAVGLPTYGRSFQLAEETNPIVGGAATTGEPARYTRTHGFYAYFEICEFLRKDETVTVWDYQSSVPFAYNGNIWISFDDTFSSRKKVQWLISEGYGGVMVWELGMDDFSGQFCGEFQGNNENFTTFPLLRAISHALGNKPEPNPMKEAIENVVVEKIDQFDAVISTTEPENVSQAELSYDVKIDDQCNHVKAKRKDCIHFWTCNRGIQYEFQCPEGTVFSDDRGECVWPYEAPECDPFKNFTTTLSTTPKSVQITSISTVETSISVINGAVITGSTKSLISGGH